jgi:hypothetical protein
MSEADLLRAVTDFLEWRGWRWSHFHDSRRQVAPGVFVGDRAAAGFPDIVAVRPPRLLFIELKSEKGKLEPEQDAWLVDVQRVADELRGSTDARIEVHEWRPSQWHSGLIERLLR